MTPKEKAKELVRKYSCYFYGIDENVNFDVVIHDDAKQCALITVDELFDYNSKESMHNYWIAVKEEIENL